ncbi:radical SAM protein [Candidatus Fermentibacteria bacterium]|nr:radical SAM protein [Candidatus Fermentibacteria bacterium]
MKVVLVVHDCLTMPLGAGYLGAVARAAGHEVRLGVLLHDDIVSLARSWGADVVGFTATTGFHLKYLALARALKQAIPSLTVVMGGAHPTFFPEVIETTEALDAICMGEGEEAFVEFLDTLEEGNDPTRIRNFWVRTPAQGIIRNPLRPRIQNLDSIPFPDRTLWHPYSNRMTLKTPFVMAGRGCPFRCSYCFNHAYNQLYDFDGRMIRRRSVDNVMTELRKLKESYPVELVVFQDDIFILDPEWVADFSRRYRSEIGVPFHCHLRANLVTKEIVTALAEAGCVSIKMAIESADDEIRNTLLKRGMSREQIIEATTMVRDAGIVLVTQNILGNPGETIEQAMETLKLNIQCKPGYAFATLLQPYPRTEIGDYVKQHGLVLGDPSNAEHTSFFHRSLLRLPDRTRMERLRMLFPLIVEWPGLLRILPLLLRLPLSRVYALTDKIWKGYAVKHREMPYRLTIREYLSSLRSYFSSSYY